jgi:type IV secretory pathway VirD2 relaxase
MCAVARQPAIRGKAAHFSAFSHIAMKSRVTQDDDLRVRLGRIRSRGNQRARPFIAQALAAAEKAGGIAPWSPSRRHAGSFGRGRASSLAANRLLTSRSRLVTIKARVVKHGLKVAPFAAHLGYLRRDDVTRDGEPARMFNAGSDDADPRAFAQRCEGDRHHFRFIVSPEDAAELSDIKGFTRDLMADAERDLGTKLDWVAVDHWNTEHPHVHVIVRGRTDDGSDLVISRDYIREGMRARAQHLVTLELGPRSDREIRHSLQSQIEAERWTRLDRALAREAATHSGVVDLRPARSQQPDEFRSVKIARLRKLEGLGLAQSLGPSRWALSDRAEVSLRELGERNDIIRRIHRGLAEKGWERGSGDYVLEGESQGDPVIGRLVDRGIDDELKASAFVVIDGVDGRVHHLRLPDLNAAGDSAPGSIVELRHYQNASGSGRIAIAVRSDLPIEEQITAQGATWLDRRLVAAHPSPLSESGFGAEVREAMGARVDHLLQEGLARRQGHRAVFARDLLDTLRRRELAAAASRLSAETGLPHHEVVEGERVDGIYRRRLALASGRFAMIDDSLGFRLVPWSPSLERHLGRQVSGIAQASGTIAWSFGRKRELGI